MAIVVNRINGCNWTEPHITLGGRTLQPCVHAAVEEVAPGIRLCRIHAGLYREELAGILVQPDDPTKMPVIDEPTAEKLLRLWQKSGGKKLTQGRIQQLVDSLFIELADGALESLAAYIEPEAPPAEPMEPGTFIDPYDEKALERRYSRAKIREVAPEIERTLSKPFGRPISKPGPFSETGVAWKD